MKLFFALFCFTTVAFAQVGINTVTPNATLDIRSSDAAAPANNDGLLIPQIDEFPLLVPTALQDGMLVYATGNGSVTKGFYYWDNTMATWNSVITGGPSIEKIDDLIDAKSDNDGTDDGSSIFLGVDAGANDDQTNNRSVGIGFNALSQTTNGQANVAIGTEALMNSTSGMQNTALGFLSMQANITGGANTAIGSQSLVFNTSGSLNSALGNVSLLNLTNGNSNTSIGAGTLRTLNSGDNNTMLGARAGFFVIGGDNNVFLGTEAGNGVPGPGMNVSNSILVGYQSGYFETNSNRLYIENSNADADNALIYGEFDNNILRTNSEFQIGNPAGTGYALPLIDGTANQILQTDGAGSTTWIDNATIGAEQINDLLDGKSDNDGTDDGSSIFLGIDAGAMDDGTNNFNVGIGYWSMVNNSAGDTNTALGVGSLYQNQTGSSNTALGYASLNNNLTGTGNVALGHSTLAVNETGDDNIAIGYLSGAQQFNANNNITIGARSGSFETGSNKLYIENSNADADNALIYGEFDNNILRTNSEFQIGNPAGTGYALPLIDGVANQILQTDGAGSTTWIDNATIGAEQINDLLDGKSDNDGTDDGSSIFLGIDAGLNDDLTNNRNVGIGLLTLSENFSGNGNTAIGNRALVYNEGDRNTAIGRAALTLNETGHDNSAIGYNALGYHYFGSYNVGIGSASLQSLTNGNNNVGIGSGAGFHINDGENNVFIGRNSGRVTGISAKSGSVNIGYESGYGETNSNRLYIENSDSSTPLIYGEFDNDILGFNGQVAIGHQAPSTPLHVLNEGVIDVQNILATLSSNTSNRPVLLFSETDTATLADGMSLEYDGRGNGDSNRMAINGLGGAHLFEFQNNGALNINSGSVYLNHPNGAATEGLIFRNLQDADEWRMYQQWSSNSFALFFNNVNVGNFDDVTGAYTSISDRRSKKNIKQLPSVIDKVKQLEVVDYNFISQQDDQKHMGFIAQDVEVLFPSLVNPPDEDEGNYTMDYSGFGVLAIKAIQEQQTEIELLKEMILKQQQDLHDLKALLRNKQ